MERCSPPSPCHNAGLHCDTAPWRDVCHVLAHSGFHAQQVGQRKFVLLFLFMATQGGGVVSGKLIMAAARRLRVT